MDFTSHQLPFNRRARRAIDRADRVVIHLYSGETKPKDFGILPDGTVVLSVDVRRGANMLHDSLFSYLLHVVASKKVSAILAGPPCPTVSRLRDRAVQDDGPRRLRSRFGSQRYGIDDLTVVEQRLVDDHSVLLLRMMMMFWMAEQVCPGQTLFALEHPADPCSYLSQAELAKGSSGSEGPRDPQQPPSIWKWPEVITFVRQFGMQIAEFDQHPLGHPKPKPTALLTNSWELYKPLHNVRCTQWELAQLKQNPPPGLEQRMKQSREWGKWAPGLSKAIGAACVAWVHTTKPQRDLASQNDRLLIAKLSKDEEAFIQHCEQDHVCFRPDCRVCLSGAIRSHQHARSKYPQRNALTLTADLIGPLVAAEDQAHARVRHLLVAAFTVPAYKGGNIEQLAEGKDCEDILIPAEFEDLECSVGLDGAEAFSFEERGEGAESEQESPESEDVGEKAKEAKKRREERWKAEMANLRKPVTVKHLVFAVPIPKKRGTCVLKALQHVHSRIRQLGLSVRRLHTDNGREFRNKLLEDWCQARDVYHTTSVPSDPRSNGLAEAFVNLAKCGIRTLLANAKAPVTDWPHAARHWAELGSPPRRSLVPFGIPVVVKKREWTRKTPHDSKTLSGTALGPSARTPGSTVVRIPDNEGGHRLYTTPVVYERVREPVRFVGQEQQDKPKRRVRGKSAPAHEEAAAHSLQVACGTSKGESDSSESSKSSCLANPSFGSQNACLSDPQSRPENAGLGSFLTGQCRLCAVCESHIPERDDACPMCGLWQGRHLQPVGQQHTQRRRTMQDSEAKAEEILSRGTSPSRQDVDSAVFFALSDVEAENQGPLILGLGNTKEP